MPFPSRFDDTDLTFDDFPVGTRVAIRRHSKLGDTICVDFHSLDVGETGTVVRNGGRYLSIIVEFDNCYRSKEDAYIDKRMQLGFNPEHLDIIAPAPPSHRLKTYGELVEGQERPNA